MRGAVLLALTFVAVACSSGHRSGTRAVISETGRIGPLAMDRSTRADVISFAGRPNVERRGIEYDSAPYLALGYDCSAKPRDDAFPVLETPKTGRTGPYCKTVFWVNRRTAKLGDFYTSSADYSASDGVRVGMKTARVERLLRRRVDVGCADVILLAKGKSALTIGFTGGSHRKVGRSGALRLFGGHAYAFALSGYRSGVGVFDCL